MNAGEITVERLSKLEQFSKVPIFTKLSPRDVEEISKLATVKSYPSDSTVFFQDEPSDSMYLLLVGSVKVADRSAEGREKMLAILGPGEIFGEIAMLDGHPRSATVTTCEASELASISQKDFRRFAAGRPEILWNIIEALCERIRSTNAGMLELFSREVPSRILAVLKDLGEKHGKTQADGSCVISLKFGVQDLAAMVGASREVVSRLLHRYQDNGLIELGQNRQLVIVNPAALAKALEYSSEWS